MRRILCLIVISALACRNTSARNHTDAAPGDDRQVLALIDGVPLTIADVEAQLAAQPPAVRASYEDPQRKKQLLDGMIRNEALANEAKKQGLDTHPEVLRVMKQQMLSLLIEREVDSRMKREVVTDADIEAYYREHKDEFNRSAAVRVVEIVTKDRAKAVRAADEARKLKSDDAGSFATLVEKYSDEGESKRSGGDLAYVERGTTRLPKPVVDAAYALKEVGEVSGPVKTDETFHVLRLTERRPEIARPLASAKDDIRERILQMRRAKKMEDFVETLRKRATIVVYEDRLARMKIDTGAAP